MVLTEPSAPIQELLCTAMEHYVILHNQVPHYVHRYLCYAAMAKYVALHNATYLAIATVFGPKNQELHQ